MNPDLTKLKHQYNTDGFISGIPIVSRTEAATHRQHLENAETELGPLHYKTKIHTLLQSPHTLATLPLVLDIVEQCIGPDILLYNCTYIIKEAGAPSHVSWHQDLTYWGLSDDDQVSMWLALSPANEDSGCMHMLPGSHLSGCMAHTTTTDANNVLLQGQTVTDVNTDAAVLCPLNSGEASFHHGWTLHASMPNNSSDRRIGLNVQYVATHVRQTKHDSDSALLVRGEDQYGHYTQDVAAASDLDPTAIQRHRELQALYEATAGTS